MAPVRNLFLLMLLLLGACSMRSAINSFTSAEDRALGQDMVSRLRSGDRAWLQRHFAPELWATSNDQLAAAPALYPSQAGTTELVGFNISTNMINGQRTERGRQFTLVTHGGGRWTTTSFRTYSNGGPDKVVQWSVVPHSAPPPELAAIDAWDAALPWVWAGMTVTLCGFGALIFWLVRRSRRIHV
jgi:hypothetical protein